MVIFMNERNLKECCQTKLSWESLNGCIAHKIEEAECSVCDTTYRRRNTGTMLYVKEQNDEDFFVEHVAQKLSQLRLFILCIGLLIGMVQAEADVSMKRYNIAHIVKLNQILEEVHSKNKK